MTEEPVYYVRTRLPEYTVDRPRALWRRAANGWEYWSAIDWDWHPLDERVPDPPAGRDMVAVSADQAHLLVSERGRWLRFWAQHRRPELGGPPGPVTVVRRRGSPEAVRDESYLDGTGWVKTTVLRRDATGRSSNVPPLEQVDAAEAARLLRALFGADTATDP